jgi:O-antigen/teichoic acid export membrane protein
VLVTGWGVALLHVWSRLPLDGIRGSARQTLEILRLSAFTFLFKTGYVLENSTDGFLAGVMLGPLSAAKLILTGRIIDALRTFAERFGSAAQPSLAQLFGEGNRKRSTAGALRFLRSGSLVTALLVGVGVAVNKQVMSVWVGPELFAGYSVTLALGTAAALLTVTNLANHVLFAYGEIEKPTKAFLAYGLVKCAVAAILARPLGIIIFPLAAIVAAAVSYSRQVWSMAAGLVEAEREGWRLLAEIAPGFAVCFAIAVASWWFHPSLGSGWITVGVGGTAILLSMLIAVGVGAKRQTHELRVLLVQGVPNWRILSPLGWGARRVAGLWKTTGEKDLS